MTTNLKWNGDLLKKTVTKASKIAVKITADAVAKGIKNDLPEDTGRTKDSVKVVEWEKEDAVGAYVKAGSPGNEIAVIVGELGSEKQAADPVMRRNLNKNKNKLKKAMTNKI